jgi:O-acetylserine/cysteine efflux transporter
MSRFLNLKVFVWLILCAIWGSTWIFIKVGLKDLPPITFAAARFLLGVGLLFIIINVQKIPLPRTAKEWKLIALTGVLQFSINYSMVFWSEQYITSGLAAVLQATITVFGLILAWIFLPSERMTAVKIFAVCLGIVGVGIVFYDQLKVQSVMAFAGCVCVVIGSYAAAQASILIKANGASLHPASLVFGQMICGLPAIIVYSLVAEGNPLTFHWTLKGIVCILYLTVFGTIAAFWLYYWLLGRIESTKAMMISLVTPLLAVIIGWVVLGETLPPQTGVGGLLIIGSIWLIAMRKKSGQMHVGDMTPPQGAVDPL